MKITWYPGHIAKAKKDIEKHLSDVDIIIEVIDARCPMSTLSPYVKSLSKNKKHLVIVGKVDLVSTADIKNIKNVLDDYGVEYIVLDNRDNTIKNIVDKKIDKILADISKRYKDKGIQSYIFKAIVVGMPNVGKSTFINSYVKKKVNTVGDKAGVTKSLQWAKISEHIYLLDTPGITVPKFESESVGTNLAYIGSINDEIIDKYELSYELIGYLFRYYKKILYDRYKIKDEDIVDNNDISDLMDVIAKKVGALKKGGLIDSDKVSRLIIDDFRKGKIGKIYLER